ncbi:MAG: CPBP family intramembrane glutamic endopeptidase [Pseudomonadota bacterium]
MLQTMIMVGLGIAAWWFSGRALADFISVDMTQIAMGLAIGAGLSAIVGAFFYSFPKISEELVRAQGHNLRFLENRLGFAAIIVISIGAGVGEEALFRAGLLTLASDYMAMPLAIFISSLLFALIHFAKPIISAIIFVIGAFFAVIYWQTGSLLAVMIGHALYDVYALWYVQKELHRIGYFEELQADTGDPTEATD